MPFAELDIERAALLAGKELADLTETDIGLASSPALLDLILQKGREAAPKPKSLADFVLAPPVAERGAWTKDLLEDTASASLRPLSFAAALAVESEDADDWKPRFQRFTGLDPALVLLPLDVANQFYRELLLRREIG
jgi:hypothetical protein